MVDIIMKNDLIGMKTKSEITLPAKQPVVVSDDQVLKAANKLLERYKTEFSNLAKR